MIEYLDVRTSLFYRRMPQTAVLSGYYHDNGYGELMFSELSTGKDYWDYDAGQFVQSWCVMRVDNKDYPVAQTINGELYLNNKKVDLNDSELLAKLLFHGERVRSSHLVQSNYVNGLTVSYGK